MQQDYAVKLASWRIGDDAKVVKYKHLKQEKSNSKEKNWIS
jgi:hypothetical protein